MKSRAIRFSLSVFFALSLIAVVAVSTPLSNYSSANKAAVDAGEGQTNSSARKLRTSSPYEIASFIADNPNADLREVWKQLGIQSVNLGFEDDEETGTDHFNHFLSKCEGCDIETYALDLDGEPGREVLLKISARLSESCRFLLFKQVESRGKREWKLLGHIDHAFGRYKMPEHFITYGGGRPLLVVSVQRGSGSGYSLYYNRLFWIDNRGIKEMLSFPSEGHLARCCLNPTKKFETRIVSYEINNGVTAVELEFSVSYSLYLDREIVTLWEKTQKAVYKSDSKAKRLILDSTKSDLSEEEIAAIYAGYSPTVEDLIRYNFKELSDIATGQEDRRKEWLRSYLDQQEQSPEVESLRRLIK